MTSVPRRAASCSRESPAASGVAGACAMTAIDGHAGPRLGLSATRGNQSARSRARSAGSASSATASSTLRALYSGGSRAIATSVQPRV